MHESARGGESRWLTSSRGALLLESQKRSAGSVSRTIRPDGFRVEFAEPAPQGARIDWQLIC